MADKIKKDYSYRKLEANTCLKLVDGVYRLEKPRIFSFKIRQKRKVAKHRTNLFKG